jgi:hypothetical protein
MGFVSYDCSMWGLGLERASLRNSLNTSECHGGLRVSSPPGTGGKGGDEKLKIKIICL